MVWSITGCLFSVRLHVHLEQRAVTFAKEWPARGKTFVCVLTALIADGVVRVGPLVLLTVCQALAPFWVKSWQLRLTHYSTWLLNGRRWCSIDGARHDDLGVVVVVKARFFNLLVDSLELVVVLTVYLRVGNRSYCSSNCAIIYLMLLKILGWIWYQ